ncbi:patatin-like phospholipase family protein [Roseitranquillus sediminis]|uniref:patatin-like phospholipase family protein n=1 Tax=Roseitranquillus sediminis TaxID=2809051 RepID=UPI001D0CB957|nr:patatin-like phospholipase family protein [Roseitranquillus sediminis]MBM9593315.1 patatin-like phospholipase family protein [Roseitranquillus sediminis]
MGASSRTRFDQLVFSGGGTRCFWQGGFLHVLRRELPLEPARISGVSGGALSASCFVPHLGLRLLDEMTRAFADQDSNVDLHQVVHPETPQTPHQRIYREVVSKVIDAEAERKIAEGPAFQVLIAHPPDDDMSALTGTASMAAYEAELHLVSSPHFNWAERCGLTTSFVDARAAAAEGKLVDLVCAAATIPPLFDIATWEDRPVVDGGMADQAPMPSPDEGRTLVLLTRRYDNVPDVAGRVYVSPSDETPADKIDFTDPAKIRRTWDLGERDALAFLNQLD